jgi:protein TonB
VPLPEARPSPREQEVASRQHSETQPAKTRQAVRKKQTPREKPARQRQQAASKPAVEAQAQVTRSNRNAARQTASGLLSSVSPARWQSRLMTHLERRKRYPSGAKSRREQGTVHVRFRIDDAGNVLSVSLARSSGFAELDNEVLALVRRASPVPAPPQGVNKTITAPVRFSVR